MVNSVGGSKCRFLIFLACKTKTENRNAIFLGFFLCVVRVSYVFGIFFFSCHKGKKRRPNARKQDQHTKKGVGIVLLSFSLLF